jgi:hypothetical protein
MTLSFMDVDARALKGPMRAFVRAYLAPDFMSVILTES